MAMAMADARASGLTARQGGALRGTALRASAARPVAPCRAGLRVEAAATKATKAETLKRIESMLTPETVFVAGVNFKGFTVRSRAQLFRARVPARGRAPGGPGAPARCPPVTPHSVDAPPAPRGRGATRSCAACRRCDASHGPSLWVARRADSRPRRTARRSPAAGEGL